MNTTQLECFTAVANFLNFSRAAEHLRITQPAVSHQINTLEDELGVKLFLRTSKSVRLTQEGFAFIQYAGEILKLTDLSKARMRKARQGLPARVVVGCRNTVELRLLAPVLARMRQEHPQVLPMLRLLPFDSLENLLLDGDVHLMFAFDGAVPKRTRYRELTQCRAVCVCAPGHPLAGQEVLTARQLQQGGMVATCRPPICPPPLFSIQRQVMGDREVGQILFCDHHEALLSLVQAGYAFAVVADLPHARLPGLRYIPLPEFEPFSFGAAYVPGQAGPALSTLLPLLQESCGSAAGDMPSGD